jgi:hypothetical protein
MINPDTRIRAVENGLTKITTIRSTTYRHEAKWG